MHPVLSIYFQIDDTRPAYLPLQQLANTTYQQDHLKEVCRERLIIRCKINL